MCDKKRLTILLTEEQHEKIKKEAERLGIPLNQYILKVLSESK